MWRRYLLGRLAGIVAVLAMIVVLTFMIVHWVPGDPARRIAGMNASAAQVEEIHRQLGLNESLMTQFWRFVTGLFSGDLGQSYINGQPVWEMIGQRLPLTAQLAVGGLAIVLLVGFPLGILAGSWQRTGRMRGYTRSFTAVTSLVGAMPEYLIGTLLIYVFALSLHALPVQGGDGVTSMILPVIAVAAAPTAMFARLVRNETLGVLSQEYMTTAASKRISPTRQLLRHVLPNVVTSTLTLGGLLLIALLGGTVITENVFNIGGLGTQVVQAILNSDYPSVQGILLVLGVIAVLINLGIDVALGLLDPRVLNGSQQ